MRGAASIAGRSRVAAGVAMAVIAAGLAGCAGSGRAPAAAPTAAAGTPAAATGTNLVSGSGLPVGDGAAPAARAPQSVPAPAAVPAAPASVPRAAAAPRPAPAPSAARPMPAPAPLVWPAPGTPVDAYLAAITPRQRECLTLMFERQDLTVERIRGMDAFPAGNLIEQSKARCDAVLPRVDPARLRSDIRCTLDLPGEPVSRCDEVFVRTVDGRSERLSAADALRAELSAGSDPARRVGVARVERDDAAAERLGGRAAGAASTAPTQDGVASTPVATPSVAAVPLPEAPAGAPLPSPVAPAGAGSPGASTASTAPASAASSAAPASPAQASASATPAPAAPSSTPTPAAVPSSPPVPRYQVLVTCGPAGQHLRVQDCFAGRTSTSLELRRADGSRQVYGPAEILRAGPTGKDGLSLMLDAPFELRARNASDTLLLGVRVVDRQGGRTLSFEQASKGGSVNARR